jgi:hypothetical protein
MEHVKQLNEETRHTPVSTVRSQHLWVQGQDYVMTSYAVVMGVPEILAFRADAEGEVVSYLDLQGERRVEDTFENHERIAAAAFDRPMRWDLPEAEEEDS